MDGKLLEQVVSAAVRDTLRVGRRKHTQDGWRGALPLEHAQAAAEDLKQYLEGDCTSEKLERALTRCGMALILTYEQSRSRTPVEMELLSKGIK